jgi:hypothetical protein
MMAPSQADCFKIDRSKATELGTQDQLLADDGLLSGPRMSGLITIGDLAALSDLKLDQPCSSSGISRR